ncbi:MAG: phosphonoacetaldehyde hydrolase [Chitinophaga sp.]|jgi:phosphonatase-like hydrolase|nr:phosphonoacetaldehyde hydrolase [Chitinophaga sp.]
MHYELVVFDIAGTTVVDAGSINETFREVFNNNGFSVSPEDVAHIMGYEKKQAITILNNQYQFNLTDELINKMHGEFIESMVSFYENDTSLKPQPYAIETFEWLHSKGIDIALNTGFNRAITDALLKNLDWNKLPFIATVVTSDEVAEGRPAPDMIKKIMAELDIHQKTNVVKIGDTEADIKEGRNAGCGLVIGVTTGAYSREELTQFKPDRIIDSLLELQELI